MAHRLVFRFDVDSHRCLGEGTRALSMVAARHDVAFTFFVHMGRATDRGRLARSVVLRRVTGNDVHRLSTRRKLGTAGLLRLAVTNPLVGAADGEEIRRLVAAGHEVGLHGGRNHRSWQESADRWDHRRLTAEIGWGLARLRAAGVDAPDGFASPAWTTSSAVATVAADFGFSYLADRHGTVADVFDLGGPLPEVSTNLLGEPGGVGYLEWCRAKGWSDRQLLDDFACRLHAIDDLAVVYDHPFWAGVHDADLVDRMLGIASRQGVEVLTLGAAVARELRG
ncbi:MAG: polysaccharide deacetylase family protein [Actinobacteria bacterium]|jgi:peptidoglycan/xylan/chitin deacetylase (PgdA/CDA1 family)|nr:polysaccharide deacetylase family protein [Actinomycetota bacterium]